MATLPKPTAQSTTNKKEEVDHALFMQNLEKRIADLRVPEKSRHTIDEIGSVIHTNATHHTAINTVNVADQGPSEDQKQNLLARIMAVKEEGDENKSNNDSCVSLNRNVNLFEDLNVKDDGSQQRGGRMIEDTVTTNSPQELNTTATFGESESTTTTGYDLLSSGDDVAVMNSEEAAAAAAEHQDEEEEQQLQQALAESKAFYEASKSIEGNDESEEAVSETPFGTTSLTLVEQQEEILSKIRNEQLDAQRKILEKIQEQKNAIRKEQDEILKMMEKEEENDHARKEQAQLNTSVDTEATVSTANSLLNNSPDGRTIPSRVTLGNQTAATLHGQEKTREAIAKGTAKLCQCMNCKGWMRVSPDAKLIYCPHCSVICRIAWPGQKNNSPVLPSDLSTATIDASETLSDAELAQRLQEIEDRRGGSNPSFIQRIDERLRDAGLTQRGEAMAVNKSSSWYNYFFGKETTPEVGSTTSQESSTAIATPRSAEITDSQRALHSSTTSNPNTTETSDKNFSGGEVATRKPFYACIATTAGLLASTMSAALITNDDDPVARDYTQNNSTTEDETTVDFQPLLGDTEDL